MPQLGLGLGINKGLSVDPVTQLIKSASLYLSADKADGQPFTKLEPRTLNNGVSNGEYTPQNVSGDVVASTISWGSQSVGTGSNFVVASKPADAYMNNQTTLAIGSGVIDNIPETTTGATTVRNRVEVNYSLNTTLIILYYPLSMTRNEALATLIGKMFRYQLATPIDTLNVPFKNPWKDLKGVVGKNLFDGTQVPFFFSGAYANGRFLGETCSITGNFLGVVPIKVEPNTTYFFSASGDIVTKRVYAFSGKPTTLGAGGDGYVGIIYNAAANGSFTTGATTTWVNVGFFSEGVVKNVTNIQLELGSTATAYEPYGKANCLLQAFAGTTADGWTTDTAPNGKSVVGLKGDGLDSLGLFGSNAPNPVGTQDFAFAFVFKTPLSVSINSWFFGRNLSTGSDHQYGLLFNSTAQNLHFFLNGVNVLVTTNNSILANAWYKYIIKRKDGVLSYRLNQLSGSLANNTNITTQPHTRLFARSNNVDGTANSLFNNWTIFELAYNNGQDIDKFEANFNKVCASKYGL